MTVVFHADPDAFLAAAQAVALRSPASESFLTIWCENLRRRPPAGERRAALRDGPGRRRERDRACSTDRIRWWSRAAMRLAVAEIADALVAEGRVVPGVHGAEDACVAFAAQWCMATGRQVRVHARLRNHALDARRAAARCARPHARGDARRPRVADRRERSLRRGGARAARARGHALDDRGTARRRPLPDLGGRRRGGRLPRRDLAGAALRTHRSGVDAARPARARLRDVARRRRPPPRCSRAASSASSC